MEDEFRKFLKQGGRSASAIMRALDYVRDFKNFLDEDRGRKLQAADKEDLEAFVAKIESEPKASAKGHLWGLVYYFRFTDNDSLRALASILREQRIERRPFLIRKFRGLDPVVLDRLQEEGIRNVNQVLAAGATPQARAELAARADVPLEAILEIVKLADLARIPGLKGIRARLYHDAGVDTLEKLGRWEPEPLRQMLIEYVAQADFNGIAPLPAEVRFSISVAKQLPGMVEY